MTSTPAASPPPTTSWLARNEFLIRRLHSLSGLIPVGAYMVVHLITNARILDGAAAFQDSVLGIHALGKGLVAVEWIFIFLPILFHAIIGVVIIRGGLPNSGTYTREANVRYTLQRATGMIAFVFIAIHVFHLHGWFHFDVWLKNVVEPLGGGQFRPYNASSTAGRAFQTSLIVPLFYAIGVLASVFHLANGIWTMGITWGVWISPRAQRNALVVCGTFGVLLAGVGLGALGGMMNVDVEEARKIEARQVEAAIEAGRVAPDPHKFSHPEPEDNKTAASEAP